MDQNKTEKEISRADGRLPNNTASKVICVDCVLICLVLLFNTIFHPVVVKGSSMEPTLFEGDKYLLLRLFADQPHRGDVVVLEAPDGRMLVKRVIGLGGDVIEIRDSRVYRNGEALDEPYAQGGTVGIQMRGPVTVEEGCVFVLGDNRPESGDSRMEYLRQIPCEDIKGRLFLRLSFHGREPTASAERL